MNNWVLNLIVGALVVSIIAIIASIASKDLTPSESTLLSVLLTVLSIIGSWIVSSFYSRHTQKETIEEVKTEHQNSLRTYALNAAEKVNNLSNELTKLAYYLKSELDSDDEAEEYALYSKIERIESAIHIVNTLKSVNDTSLSDWKGVIGDELEEREEEKEEREERLLELTEKIENIVNSQSDPHKRKSDPELTYIRQQLDFLSKNMSSPSVSNRTNSTKSKKAKVVVHCPNCDSILSYTQRSNIRGQKAIKCSNCDKRAISRFSEEKGFFVTSEEFLIETFECPWCGATNKKKISNVPFTKEIFICSDCGDRIKVTRKFDLELSISAFGKQLIKEDEIPTNTNVEITSELLDKVESCLPKQPWPESIHKTVAEQLGVSNSTAYKCISKLIVLGKCNPQINGEVYVKKEEQDKDK